MGRKRHDASAGLAAAIERTVDEKIEERQAVEEATEIQEIDEVTSEVPLSIKKLLSSFPSSEGYYAKIWRIKEDGQWELKDYTIEAPETIPDNDLVREVNRIAKDKQWEPGHYQVQVRQRGTKGVFINQKVLVGNLSPIEKKDIPTNPVSDQLDLLSKTISTVDKIRPSVNVESISNTIMEAIKTGKSMADSNKGNGQDSLILAILPIIKDLLVKPEAPKIEEIVERILAKIQPQKPQEDFFQQLIKYQEVTNKLGKRDTGLDSVKNVTDIVTALRPLTGGGGGIADTPSWSSMLIEHGAKLIEPLIGAFKEFSEAKKLEMEVRLKGFGGQPTQLGLENQPPALLPNAIHPFVSRLMKSVNENDETYFDTLRQRIFAMGPHFIDGLVSGELSYDMIIEIAHEGYGLPLDNQKLRAYFEKFTEWLKQEMPEEGKVDGGENIVSG